MPDANKDTLLTLNVGSSSIKFALFDRQALDLRLLGQLDAIGAETHFKAKLFRSDQHFESDWEKGKAPANHIEALAWLIDWLGENLGDVDIAAVGHRVVHGGLDFDVPVLIDDAVIEKLRLLEPLAPLHQPHNLAGIEAARQAFGQLPQVACFDTAFHCHQPFVKDCFALPRSFYEAGVRRYGFHGLSYEYIADHLQTAFPLHASGRVIVAHLGNGASMCAMLNGHSIASTMGFSALDGLPMGTRCGQLDPGVLLYLMQDQGMTADEVSDLLYKESGLKGLSGISNDMRVLESSDRLEARQAIDYFVYRVKREIGALTAALEGLDAIVFTGGIGEHSVGIREKVLQSMAWLGIELEEDANRAGHTILSSTRSRVLCLQIPTNEEHMIAKHTHALVH
ncbi:MAG: acetate/propionate family kinase [Orrella sp.]